VLKKKKKIKENNGGEIDSKMEGSSEITKRRRKTWDKVMLLKLCKRYRWRHLKLGF
jgi:hypothetical protein